VPVDVVENLVAVQPRADRVGQESQQRQIVGGRQKHGVVGREPLVGQHLAGDIIKGVVCGNHQGRLQ